jgi:hypothetical protein
MKASNTRHCSRWTVEEKNVIINNLQKDLKGDKLIKTCAKSLKTRSYNAILAMSYIIKTQRKDIAVKNSPVIKTINQVYSSKNPVIRMEFKKDHVRLYF